MSYWLPVTEESLLLALDGGTVEENHHLEFKREIGHSDGERKETGRDLASLAIDGGVLIVGVDEPERGKFVPAPVLLAGESERIEQIAANRAQPGLAIRARTISSSDDPERGYVVVEVPPSPSAPHMVDGKYWARNEKTKRSMGDAEVVLMHGRREGIEDRVEAMLADVAFAAPHPPPRARMYLAAHPIAAPENAAAAFVRRGPDGMIAFSMSGEKRIPPGDLRSWPPSWAHVSRTVMRLGAVARTTLNDGQGNNDALTTRYGESVEVRTSGDLLVLASMIWDTQKVAWAPDRAGDYLYDGAVLAWVFRVVGLVASLAEEIEYRGPWALGLRIDGLDGLLAAPDSNRPRRNPPRLTVPNFTRITSANRGEIDEHPGAIVERLLTDLLVNLGRMDDWEYVFAKPSEE